MHESLFLNPAEAVARAKVHAGARIAEFGAGAGFFARAAAREAGDGGAVWAVDTNPELLVRIKNLALAEGLHTIEIIQGDVERPRGSNLPGNHFDLVIIANSLFSADNRLALAHEAHRILNAHGRALVIDWRDSFGGMGPHPEHIITVGAARDIFEKEGFAYVEDVPAGSFHWGFVVRKK